MQNVAVCDERGRLTLGKEVTQKFGREFHIVVMPKEVVLIPVPEDPIRSLQVEGRKLPKHLSIKALKKIARDEAIKESLGNWKKSSSLKRGRRKAKK